MGEDRQAAATMASSTADARTFGRSLRADVPRSSHGGWVPAADRGDPVQIIEDQNADRVPWLAPLRRGRMSASPFTFFRGSAAIMAADLAATPRLELPVQLCGDGHLSNFGLYGSPERKLVFDLNDFDETLPGPFDWDVKRLAASFTIAAQHRDFDPGTQRALAETAARSYREAVADFASKGWLTVVYSHVAEADLTAWLASTGTKGQVKRLGKAAAKARSRDSLAAAVKLVEPWQGGYRFRSSPPVLVPVRELPQAEDEGQIRALVDEAFSSYRQTLDEKTRLLVDRYRFEDLAMKVVGVGSVGTRCWVGLFMGRLPEDVLLLQVKEATASVLEGPLPASRFRLHGRRVVEGQRLMQAASDIFLGWSSQSTGRHYYWRQLKDWKGSFDPEQLRVDGFERYAQVCGFTLARSHSVSGDPAAIAGYLGKGTVFDESIGEFAMRYAAQNAKDYAAFTEAIEGGLAMQTDG